MYQSWLRDKEEKHEEYKNYLVFLGAFHNQEMAQKIIKNDNPDYVSNEDDFEKATETVVKIDELIDKSKNVRRRRRNITNEE